MRARAAFQAGDRFFQTQFPLMVTERTLYGTASGDHQGFGMKTRAGDHADVLGLIEEEGWRLDNVGVRLQADGIGLPRQGSVIWPDGAGGRRDVGDLPLQEARHPVVPGATITCRRRESLLASNAVAVGIQSIRIAARSIDRSSNVPRSVARAASTIHVRPRAGIGLEAVGMRSW
jgi:hypothetical protein